MTAAYAGVAERADAAMSSAAAYRDSKADRRFVRGCARLGGGATMASFQRRAAGVAQQTSVSRHQAETQAKPMASITSYV